MAFLLYFVGFIVFIAGFGWILTTLGVADVYVNVAAVILLALAVFAAAARARAGASDPA